MIPNLNDFDLESPVIWFNLPKTAQRFHFVSKEF